MPREPRNPSRKPTPSPPPGPRPAREAAPLGVLGHYSYAITELSPAEIIELARMLFDAVADRAVITEHSHQRLRAHEETARELCMDAVEAELATAPTTPEEPSPC